MTMYAQNSHALTRVSIAIVDDSDALRRVVRSVLTSLGCTSIAEADTIATAEVLMQTQEIDVYLVDWNLRSENGLDFVRTLRRNPSTQKRTMAVIMMTAHKSDDHEMAALAAGADVFLAKPFTASDLYSAITHALRIVTGSPSHQIVNHPAIRHRELETA